MRGGNRRRPTGSARAAVAFAVSTLVLCAPVAVAWAGPPINDNYLSSLRLNDPGTPLNKTDTLRDVRDTSGATLQTDVFNPPMAGGPAEPATCQGVNYGATVWYDFHPDVDGAVRIRTSGFDNVISLIPFSGTTLLPDFASRTCVTNLSTMTHELDSPVLAGHDYTVQIGGVSGAQGPLEFLFDFLPQINRITADATLSAHALANGVSVKSLQVTATAGSRVEVRCTQGCTPQAATARTVTFPRLRGHRLPAGAKLEIFVTAPHAIGAYIEYRIGRGSFTKLDRCLPLGSHKPQPRCT